MKKRTVKKNTAVNPSGLPRPVGYSHGILLEGSRFLFLAGQTGVDPQSKVVAGDFAAQFEQALKNLLEVLKEAGGRPADIGSMRIYVTDRSEYGLARPAIGETWRKFMGGHYPAMALIEVKGLWDPGAKVEIEGMAVLRDARR